MDLLTNYPLRTKIICVFYQLLIWGWDDIFLSCAHEVHRVPMVILEVQCKDQAWWYVATRTSPFRDCMDHSDNVLRVITWGAQRLPGLSLAMFREPGGTWYRTWVYNMPGICNVSQSLVFFFFEVPSPTSICSTLLLLPEILSLSKLMLIVDLGILSLVQLPWSPK